MVWLCVGIVIIAYIFIIWERFDRAISALLGAFIIMMLGLVPYEEALAYVELDVLFLLIGMMVVVYILSETGVFEWIAISIAQKSKGVGWKILLGLLGATAVLSAFLDNVTTIILIVPITFLICEVLAFPIVPFIILEVMFANIGGAATLIGDPPNILIGHAGDLTFTAFILHLTPVVIVIWGVSTLATHFVFSRKFVSNESAQQQIQEAEPNLAIVDSLTLKRAVPVFILILTGFIFSHSLGVGPGIIALGGAAIMTVITRKNFEHVLRAVEWNTILFLGALFILVGALNHFGLFDQLGQLVFGQMEDRLWLTAIVLLWLSGIASAVLGSVPITMAFIPLVHSLIPPLATLHGMEEHALAEPLWWALALGVCLGGNGTMLGAPVNIVAVQLARQNRSPIKFMQFIYYGAPFAFVSLCLASVYLYVRYY